MEASKTKKPTPKSRGNLTEPNGQIPEVPTFDEFLSTIDNTQKDLSVPIGEGSSNVDMTATSSMFEQKVESNIERALEEDQDFTQLLGSKECNEKISTSCDIVNAIDQQQTTDDQSVITSTMYPILSDINIVENLSTTLTINESYIKEEACLYPSLDEMADSSLSLVVDEAELLNEHQLLEFYHNDRLEIIDDFIDSFHKNELEPHYSFYELLIAYKNACENIQSNEDLKSSKSTETHNVNERIWSVSNHKVVLQGKCGCDRVGYGESHYQKAEIHPELLLQLKESMDSLVLCELDVGLCQGVRACSLELQIHWSISELRECFYNENSISRESGHLGQSSLRHEIKGALSDLFHFLRFPLLPQRFRQSLISWITQLAAILLDVPTSEDQIFLLAHVLRVPSPLESWAPPLIQTFVTTPTLDLKIPIDNFVAMLSMLMQPIKYRDSFLLPILRFYEGENGWNMVTESGELDDENLTDINERDLIELLTQFAVMPLFGIAFRYFTLIHKGIRIHVLCSLVSFAGTLLKILDEGLNTYCKMIGFCKRIADIISKIISCFCTYWRLIRTDLKESERRLMQNEVNRIMLQAIFYLISKNNAVIRQFLVSLPYDTVTENCRFRCQLLLRESPNKNATTVSSLYLIPDSQLLNTLKSCTPLVDQLGIGSRSVVSEDDYITYTVQALASIVSYSEQDLLHFVTEIIDICFLNETTRQNLYKVGSEAMAILLERNPNLLSPILRYIDRYVDHLDDYVVNILKNVPLHKCILSCEDVTDRLGKWLIQRPVNHPASSIARLVLTSMNWSDKSKISNGEMNYWIPIEVHNICAETLVKAHFVHCKQRNNLISKPLNKIARLATKCPDLEQMFDRFCWDILIKLKISENPSAPAPPNDLTAFFLFCIQKCLSCPNEFMLTGIQYFLELVNSSCYYAALVILFRAVPIFSSKIHLLTGNSIFCDCFERLLHADDSSYAYNALQVFTGSDTFPGPVLTFLSSAIIYQLYINDLQINKRKQLTLTWLQLLTCQKPSYRWNDDKNILFLIGRLTECAFVFDPNELFGTVEIIQKLYRLQYQQWKSSSGPFSWFSSNIRPQLISSSLFSTSKWATYLLLRAEQEEFPEFYTQLYNVILKYFSRSLEDNLKKASSKSGINFTINNLPYFRWLQLCIESSDSIKDLSHPVFTLALQQLAFSLFHRRNTGKDSFCPGWQFYKCKQSEELFDELHLIVLKNSGATHKDSISNNTTSDSINPATAPIQTNALLNAFFTWIGSERCFQTENSIDSYSDLPFDYLLQLIFSGNKQVWDEFIDHKLHEKTLKQRANLFSKLCHLLNGSNIILKHQLSNEFNSLSEFFASFESNINNITNVKSKPILIIDSKLPFPDRIVCSSQNNSTFGFKSFSLFAGNDFFDTVQRFISYMEELNIAAREFLDVKDFVNKSNYSYIELFKLLYKQFDRKLQISIRCGNILQQNCPKPSIHEQLVKPFEYQQEIADNMNDNRQKRENEIAKLLSKINNFAIVSARLEYLCIDLCKANCSNKQYFSKLGLRLFYEICSNVQGDQLLFPLGMYVLSTCLKKLGSTFVANVPDEQTKLMSVVLAGNPLNHLLVEHFTPHCVQPPELLAKLYSNLSSAVRQPDTSTAALSLLRCLDIEHAGRQLPSNQFQALIPVMFENLVASTLLRNSKDLSLQKLCLSHYLHTMFHHFPFNFTNGLRLALSGCDKHYIPASLFEDISVRLNIDSELSTDFSSLSQQNLKSSESMCLDAEKAIECINIIENQLISSRRELNISLFSVWSPYLEHICKLSEFFLRSYVRSSFRADAPAGIMEKELDRIFHICLKCWSLLLEPIPMSNLPPWNKSDVLSAQKVLDYFIRFLLWLPYSLYIPPDRECPESLFWNYFTSKLVNEQIRNSSGGSTQNTSLSHIYSVYENKLVALNWNRFWPTLLDFGTIDQLLDYSSKQTESLTPNNHISSMILEIFVRLPWNGLVQQYLGGYHPLDATRTFHSLLLSIIAKCILRRTNYQRSRASMCNKIKYLCNNCQWIYVKSETIVKVGALLQVTFPSVDEWFNGHNSLDEVQQYFLEIWRKVCHVSTVPLHLPTQITPKELEISKKQAIYLRTQLSLLFRLFSNTIESEQKLKYYYELLDKANFLITSADDKMEYLDFAFEFITCWSDYFNQHQGDVQQRKCLTFIEQLYNKLLEWIKAHSDSLFILFFANISRIFERIPNDYNQFSLGIAEACINAYFKRNSTCSDWNEICHWVELSKSQIDRLFIAPNPTFLVLYAHLHKNKSDELAVLSLARQLSSFLINIKPKYISKSESSFVLCVGEWNRLCVNFFKLGNPLNVLYYHFNDYLGWLLRVYTEEGVGGGIISIVTHRLARRQLYSLRLKLLANIVHLFLSQNLTSSKQPPRLQRGQPVFNNKLTSFRDLQNNKSYAEFNTIFAEAEQYFTNSLNFCLYDAELLFQRLAELLYTEEKFFKK